MMYAAQTEKHTYLSTIAGQIFQTNITHVTKYVCSLLIFSRGIIFLPVVLPIKIHPIHLHGRLTGK